MRARISVMVHETSLREMGYFPRDRLRLESLEPDRLVARGAARAKTYNDTHKVIVLDDPQGNVFCVIEANENDS